MRNQAMRDDDAPVLEPDAIFDATPAIRDHNHRERRFQFRWRPVRVNNVARGAAAAAVSTVLLGLAIECADEAHEEPAPRVIWTRSQGVTHH